MSGRRRPRSAVATLVVGVLVVVLAIALAVLDRPTGGKDGASGSTCALGALPAQTATTVAEIQSHGPFPFRQDGVVFDNRERELPTEPHGYYHEYTVVTPGSPDRGTRRVIAGGPGVGPRRAVLHGQPLRVVLSGDGRRLMSGRVGALDLRLVDLDVRAAAQEALTVQWVGVHQACERAEFGDRAAAWTLAEVRGMASDQSDERRVDVAAVLDGQVVGGAGMRLPQRDNRHRLDVTLVVHPDHRRRGVGTALLQECERVAVADGRRVVAGESQEALPGTGTPAAFAQRHGYDQANEEIRSDLDIDGDSDLPTAEKPAGYLIESVSGELPGSWLADHAVLEAALSSDIPTGDLDVEAQVWDAARAERAVRSELAMGQPRFQSVARDLRTGHLVAFTVIRGPGPGSTAADQDATLVLEAHRGHRLGLAVKAANLRLLLQECPHVRQVRTWNATDNEPMLRVNRAFGFVPVGRLVEWQRTLGPR